MQYLYLKYQSGYKVLNYVQVITVYW